MCPPVNTPPGGFFLFILATICAYKRYFYEKRVGCFKVVLSNKLGDSAEELFLHNIIYRLEHVFDING